MFQKTEEQAYKRTEKISNGSKIPKKYFQIMPSADEPFLFLQQTIGNTAVQRLIGSRDPYINLRASIAFLARQKAPKQASKAACTMNFLDNAFLALSENDREKQLNLQCPQGFSAS